MLVVPNRAPLRRAVHGPDASRHDRSTVDLAGQAIDPDGDTLYFAVLRRTPRAVRPRRSTNGAGALTVTFDPDDGFAGPATFSYTVDDEQGHTVAGCRHDRRAATEQPAADGDRRHARPSRPGSPTNIDLSALVTDPDTDDTLTYAITGPAEGVAQLAQDGSNVAATAAIDAADAHRLVPVHRDRQRRAVGHGARWRWTVTAPSAPPPQAQGDAATTNQGQAVTVAVLGNDIDPLGGGLTVTSARRDVGGWLHVDRRPSGDVHAGRRRSSARRRSSTASATWRTSAARESEAQVTITVIGQPSAPGSPSPCAGNARPPSTGPPRRPTARRSTATSCAGQRLHPGRRHADRRTRGPG